MNKHTSKAFLSDATQEALRCCVMCDVDVIERHLPYAIEKSFKHTGDGEIITLFEMLICEQCAFKMNERMSVHSRQTIAEMFAQYKVQEKISAMANENWQDFWHQQCVFTGQATSNMSEYNIIGHFYEGEPVLNTSPFVIGSEALAMMQENLSAETKEELDNFRDQYLGPDDPVLRALLKESTFVLV